MKDRRICFGSLVPGLPRIGTWCGDNECGIWAYGMWDVGCKCRCCKRNGRSLTHITHSTGQTTPPTPEKPRQKGYLISFFLLPGNPATQLATQNHPAPPCSPEEATQDPNGPDETRRDENVLTKKEKTRHLSRYIMHAPSYPVRLAPLQLVAHALPRVIPRLSVPFANLDLARVSIRCQVFPRADIGRLCLSLSLQNRPVRSHRLDHARLGAP